MFWKDKVIFLTGASSGIGEALALEMSKRGAIVGLLARREPLLQEINQKIENKGGIARHFACDISDETSVTDAAQALRNEFGRIDILIANAGIGGTAKNAKELRPGDFRRVIDTNLVGAVNAVSAVLPQMLERGSGQLVAVSSLAGFRGLPKSAAYCASKAGMTAFFESVRLTSARSGKMPFLMELEDSIPLFLRAIEKRKKFAAFPWQLATVVRAGRHFPAWLYDKIAGRAKYRE